MIKIIDLNKTKFCQTSCYPQAVDRMEASAEPSDDVAESLHATELR